MTPLLLNVALVFLRPTARLMAKVVARLEWLKVAREIRSIPELWRIYGKFRRSAEAGWTIAEDDVLRLYRLVRHYQPRRILELGTGTGLSTAVMALALRRPGAGRITSLEQLPKCIEIARTLIDPELQPYVRIIHARPITFRIPGVSRWISFCGYDWVPAAGEQFDFVFVDGPAGWVEDGELVSLDSGDLFRLLPYLAPHCRVYVDGRRSTVKKIRRYLSRYLTLVDQDSEFTLFERNDRPVSSLAGAEIVDAKLAAAARSPSPYAGGALPGP